jgi:hypothetical protein
MVSFKAFGLPRFMPEAFGSNFGSDYELAKVPSKRYLAFVAEHGEDAELPAGMYKWDTVRVARPAPERPEKDEAPKTQKRRWRSVGEL